MQGSKTRKEEIKSESKEKYKCKQSQYFRYTRSQHSAKFIKRFLNQEIAEDPETKFPKCWENYMPRTKEDDQIICVSCRTGYMSSVLHKRKMRLMVIAREKLQDAEEDV